MDKAVSITSGAQPKYRVRMVSMLDLGEGETQMTVATEAGHVMALVFSLNESRIANGMFERQAYRTTEKG